MDKRLQVLGSPGFVAGLLALLANDLLFKEQFHNGLTGKLSDFAGLFVFPLFWSAFFPRRKTVIYVSSAVLFVFWKSIYSQFLIDGWNSLPFFGIQRTVDYTDLWALIVLPLSYFYSDLKSSIYVPNRLIYVVALVSVFAFTATSFSYKTQYDNKYQFQTSKKELFERISRLPKNEVSQSFGRGDKLKISFDSCYGEADVTLHEQENQTVITLTQMDYRCPHPPAKDERRQYFEKEFIDKLREEPVRKSEQISYIWNEP